MKKERIGIFGGTFNPIHQGHVHAAEIIKRRFSLNSLFLVPVYIPPHKTIGKVEAASHRLKMVELAFKDKPDIFPSSLEIEAQGTSYSIKTLNKFHELFPEARIFFVLGIDAFLDIETWKDYNQVLEKCLFIVMNRPGYSLESAKQVLGGRYESRIHFLDKDENLDEDRFNGTSIFLVSIDALDVSSTEIREKIKKNESLKGLVPGEVESYIHKHQLYR